MKIWKTSSQTKPKSPVITNAMRQLDHSVIVATRGVAIMAPRLDPLLQAPINRDRASRGTHVDAAFANEGHAPASPTAINDRKAHMLHNPLENAVSAPAVDHHTIDSESPRRIPSLSSTHP